MKFTSKTYARKAGNYSPSFLLPVYSPFLAVLRHYKPFKALFTVLRIKDPVERPETPYRGI